MALIGLVRVSTDKQETARQWDALREAGCLNIFEEKRSGKLKVKDRPILLQAISYLREGDFLTVSEVSRLGRNTLEGLITLRDLFDKGIAVRILDGLAKGDHVEESLILDIALAISAEQRREIARATKKGLDAARKRGAYLGRRKVMTPELTHVALTLRKQGYTLRQIRPHLPYKLKSGETRFPSIGAISTALAAHDRGDG